MKVTVRVESYNISSCFIIIHELQRCILTVARQVSLSFLLINIFSIIFYQQQHSKSLIEIFGRTIKEHSLHFQLQLTVDFLQLMNFSSSAAFEINFLVKLSSGGISKFMRFLVFLIRIFYQLVNSCLFIAYFNRSCLHLQLM